MSQFNDLDCYLTVCSHEFIQQGSWLLHQATLKSCSRDKILSSGIWMEFPTFKWVKIKIDFSPALMKALNVSLRILTLQHI